ncbi:hypothetical protein [Actinoplanes aureus]|uniref:Nephrocystin 3-like N-terminal domain-containing protein n=1 Tax=Actinoplanes aureus TaxID=2792083 RepID=A0A931CE41_9ACTN|nr:hypothetical protein [Actinoplanes aureus]MBG0564866.1 hypothetical protein [Actinoplanes aureus]
MEQFVGRTWVLDLVGSWLRTGEERFLLLVARPGWGKTAVARWLTGDATRLRDAWAATYFCVARGQRGTVQPGQFTEDLAGQLARDPAYAAALMEANASARFDIDIKVGTNRGTVAAVEKLLLGQQDPEEAYQRAVRAPLRRLPPHETDRVILVDALDESLTVSGRTTIAALLAGSGDLPEGVRFVLTTRPDPRVLELFDDARIVDLHEPAFRARTRADLTEYVTARLPGGDVERLVETADGNFLYARWVLDEMAEGRRTDLATLPRGLFGLYRDFLDRLLPDDTDIWLDRYEPLFGCLTVANPAAPDANLPRWLGWPRGNVSRRLRDVSQLVEYVPDSGYRLYHRSVTEFLAAYRYRDNGGWHDNKFFVEPAAHHERIARYYLERIAGEWAGDWSRCDTYGINQLVGHLRAACELSEDGDAADLYRVALDPGFQAAQQDRTGGIHVTLNGLRSALEVAVTGGPGGLLPALRCVASFRRLTGGESLSRAVFAAIEAKDFRQAVKKMSHYTTGPETGLWTTVLQLYVAWEAAAAGASDQVGDLVTRSVAYRSELADALRAAVARVPVDAGAADPSAESRIERAVERLERATTDGETEAASGFAFVEQRVDPLMDPETSADVVIDIEQGLRRLIAAGRRRDLLDRALAAVLHNPYPRYRDTALQALGVAALASPDHGWAAFRLRKILRAGLDDEGVTFTFDLPAMVAAACRRRGIAAPGLDQYVEQGAGTADVWGTRLRALSAQAAAAFRHGDAKRAALLLEAGRQTEITYAGYGVTAALALVDRCDEIGRPDLADTAQWGNGGNLTLPELAADFATRVYDRLFGLERIALVREHAEWRAEPVPDQEVVAGRLAHLPDRDTRAAYRNHVAARWGASPDRRVAARVGSLVPGALFDATGLDALLARLAAAALPALTDAQVRDLAALVEAGFTTGRPWRFGQWR